ncbi:MAG: DMT family transporter [Gammaproteobacteria bacterium]
MHLNPYVLLVLTTLFWSGNFVLARFTHADIPPLALSFWRWAGAGLILLPFVIGPIRRQWPLIVKHWKLMVLLGVLGVANFNSFVYLGLQHTTATNAVLINSAMPLEILALAWLLFRTPVSAWQWIGVLTSMIGVGVIIIAGQADGAPGLEVNRGDLWIVAAGLSWALYSVLLRRRPEGLDPMAFLGTAIVIGVMVITPFWLWEHTQVRAMTWDQTSILMVIYVSIFPSLLAYIFWNKAVSEVGPGTAGQFIHLMPLFGTTLAVLLVDERPGWHHLAGAILILAGIITAERNKPRTR